MNKQHAKRRERFRRYFEERFGGDRERLLKRHSGISKSRLSQALSDRYPFGERAASSLADDLGLAPDYFESDHPAPEVRGRKEEVPPKDPKLREVWAEWGMLFEEQKDAILASFRKARDDAWTVYAEMNRRGLLNENVAREALGPAWAASAQKDLPQVDPTPDDKAKKGG